MSCLLTNKNHTSLSRLPPAPEVLDRSTIGGVGHRMEDRSAKGEGLGSSRALAFWTQRRARRRHIGGCSQVSPTMTSLTFCLGGSTAAFHNQSDKRPERIRLATVLQIVRLRLAGNIFWPNATSPVHSWHCYTQTDWLQGLPLAAHKVRQRSGGRGRRAHKI